jgi:hypothetical protein
MFGELGRDNGRCRAGKDGLGGGEPVEIGIDRLLDLDLFRPVFLHQADAIERGRKRGRDVNAREST